MITKIGFINLQTISKQPHTHPGTDSSSNYCNKLKQDKLH